ncbi:MAG: hypothetical protein RSD71_07295 [Flavobacterium sp.]|uniref:hypothetical protein n=1 Tax=Flavobacterium sp. TaxID=239 RepID=UPI002FC73BD6
MSKVLDHRDAWYQELAPRDYYLETDLERTIKLYLEVIFPDFKVFSFKQQLVHSVTGNKSAADLGMIKSDYSEWYVIEVELGKHSKSEVLEQIDTFRNFRPTIDNSTYIYKERSDFNKAKLDNLIVSKQPNLMVIVNEAKPDWKKDLAKFDCKLCIFQIYNDFENKKLYRIDGDYPSVYTDFCFCKYEKYLPSAVKILNTDFLNNYNISNGETIDIFFEGKSYLWTREDDGRDIYLVCNSSHPPLDPMSSRYRLNYYSAKRAVPKSNFLFKLLGLKKEFNQNTFVFKKD